MFNFLSLSDFVNHYPRFKTGKYRSSNPSDWMFYEAFRKLTYLFSGAVENHFTEIFYKHKEAQLVWNPKFYEESNYDSRFIRNNLEYILEFKSLSRTGLQYSNYKYRPSVGSQSEYIPTDETEEKQLGFSSVILHTDKYKKLLESQNTIRICERKEVGIIFLCYLQAEKRLVYKLINSVEAPIGFQSQPGNSNIKDDWRPKESYFLNLDDFKSIENVNDITVEDIIEKNCLQWILNEPVLMNHLHKINRLDDYGIEQIYKKYKI